MSKRPISSIVLAVALFATSSTALFAQPSPPMTGPMSVQMFQGGSTNTWVAVYPPTTYASGAAIPVGKFVTIKVYRSYDGANFSTPVRVVSGGKGTIGQGEFGSKKKPWIDLKLETPVDNKSPYLVSLAVTAVVDGVESPLNASNLTFRYYPGLTRFDSPAAAGLTGQTQRGNTSSGPLAGRWHFKGGGTMIIKESGNRVTGSVSQNGYRIGLSGRRSNRRYNLTATLTFEGRRESVSVTLDVSRDDRITGVARFKGESIPLEFRLAGRTIIPA